MQRISGQPRAIATLQAGLDTGHLHHAYIFHGPTGVGKFTTALAFARLLLCQQPQRTLTGEMEACGSCASCRLFAPDAESAEPGAMQEAHPDLHVVTKELAIYSDDRQIRSRKLMSIPVEVLRSALIEPVYRRSQMTGGTCDKVFVLDEAELLNPTGQNLLLKTLEEPPPRTVIILVTSSEDRLLPTIRSRCQRVTFVPLSDEIVSGWIEGREGVEMLSTRERQWLISFAGGSLGRAKLAIEYDLAQWARAVLPDLHAMGSGQPPRTPDLGAQIAEMIDGFAQTWVDRHVNASKDAANKLAAGLMWSMIATYAREKVAGAADEALPGDPVTTEAAVEPWLGVIDAVEQAQRLLESNVNMGLVCDHLVTSISQSLSGAPA